MSKTKDNALTHAVLSAVITRNLGTAVVNYATSSHCLTQRFGEAVDAAVKSVPIDLPKAEVTKWIRNTITAALVKGIKDKGAAGAKVLTPGFNVAYTNSGKIKAADAATGFYVNGQGKLICASSLAVMISNAGGRFKDCGRDFEDWVAMGAARFQAKAQSTESKSVNAKGTIEALDKGRALYRKLYSTKITKKQAEELVRAISAIVS